MAVTFCPIASGSSGNSIYVGTEHTHILIDAGITGKRAEAGLKELQVKGDSLNALLITHEHKDHIKGAGVLSRRFDIPIFATPGTWEGMKNEIGTIAVKNIRYLYSGENCIINDMCIRPFEIPHDAAEPVGFNIFVENTKVTVATDIGHVTDAVRQCICDSDLLLLEANHDINMLKNGSYPWLLKKRIWGDRGHLSNVAAGNLISEIMSEKLKYIYLGHLSNENNIPHLAYETVESILKEHHIYLGNHLKMDLAARYSNSKAVHLT